VRRRHSRSDSTSLIAVPDGGRQLSEGLLVDASVVARLLRVRLLEIDARLVVAPAQVRDVGSRAPPPGTHAIGTRLAAAERLLGDSSRT
jgi:hypothetical protein